MVNWENLDGELVEKLVAALILLDNPQGNRITPSQGDRGVDVIVDTPTGAAIYQVKRYTRPLVSAQRREIEQSWRRVVERIVPEQTVASWTLVMPWDPTHERREWMQAMCSTHPEIAIQWFGRSQLDYLAAQHPRLIDYFLGGGQARTLDLMAQAIGGGEPLSSDLQGERLLEAISRRQDMLIEALNEVDPFYRCEREVRYGRLTEQSNLSEIDPRGAVWIKFEQLTADRFAVLRWIPLCAESRWLRPIGFQLTLTAEQGSTDHEEAITRFARYRAPFTDVPGEVTASTGPTGGAIPPGRGLFSIAQSSVGRADTVDLEYRVCEADGSVVASVDLVDVEITRGLVANPGYRVAGRDRSGFLHVEVHVGIEDEPQRLSIDRLDFVGLTPREVLPAVRLCAATTPGRLGEIAVRDGGRSLTGPWLFEDAPQVHQAAADCAELARLCDNLMEIQRHTLARVVFPPADTPIVWNEHISDVADLIRGNVIERRWLGPLILVDDQPDFDHSTPLEVLIEEVLVADVVGSVLETDVHVRRLIRGAVFASQADGQSGSRLVPADGIVATERRWRVDDADWVRQRVLARPIPPESLSDTVPSIE